MRLAIYLDVFPPHSPLTVAGIDYTSVSVVLNFNATTTSHTVMIMTTPDKIVDAEETFTLTATTDAVNPQSVSTTVTITNR